MNVSGSDKDGQWQTYCCHEKGNLFTLKEKFNLNPKMLSAGKVSPKKSGSGGLSLNYKRSLKEQRKRAAAKAGRASASGWKGPSMDDVKLMHERLLDEPNAVKYLTETRGFSMETIKHFMWGLDFRTDRSTKNSLPDLVMPYIEGGEVVAIKKRCFIDGCSKEHKWNWMKGGKQSLYGIDALEDAQGDVVYMCEAELDLASAWQMDLRPVVALPGAGKDLTDEMREAMAKFDKVILLYDQFDKLTEKGEHPADKGAEKIAKTLGAYRCYRAVFPAHDMNSWLQEDPDSKEVLEVMREAIPFWTPEMKSAHDLTFEVIGSMDPDSKGPPTGYKVLDKIMGAARDAEITMLTAHTSIGKTTFSTDWGRLQAQMGEPVLYLPIEGGPKGVLKKLWSQELGGTWRDVYRKDSEAFWEMVKGMEKLPFYIMPKRAYNYDEFKEICFYFVRRYGGRRVIVDHLHHLVRKTATKQSEERFCLDQWMSLITEIAGETGMHMWVISHPSKPKDAGPDWTPDLNDFKGSSAGYQDPDNFLVLGRTRTRDRDSDDETADIVPTKITGAKIRDDEGWEGQEVFFFHKDSQRYMDRPEQAPTRWAKPRQDNDVMNWFD